MHSFFWLSSLFSDHTISHTCLTKRKNGATLLWRKSFYFTNYLKKFHEEPVCMACFIEYVDSQQFSYFFSSFIGNKFCIKYMRQYFFTRSIWSCSANKALVNRQARLAKIIPAVTVAIVTLILRETALKMVIDWRSLYILYCFSFDPTFMSRSVWLKFTLSSIRSLMAILRLRL